MLRAEPLTLPHLCCSLSLLILAFVLACEL
jgi:hypothetical protein